MSPVHMDELPANVQAKILQQMSVDDTLSPTPRLASEMNQVADAVIQGVNDFAKVLPQIVTLKEYFDTAERDSANRLKTPIKSCRTWTEFCRTHLGENIRTIQRLLRDVNKKPKLKFEPAEVSPETEESDLYNSVGEVGRGECSITLKNIEDTRNLSMTVERLTYSYNKIQLLCSLLDEPDKDDSHRRIQKVLATYHRAFTDFAHGSAAGIKIIDAKLPQSERLTENLLPAAESKPQGYEYEDTVI